MDDNDMDAPDQHPNDGVTEEEAALYDRQIRLWGVEAQNRMRRSSVLMINLRGITSEACKNIVLAGIGSITILDSEQVQAKDLGCGIFFRDEDVGQKRVDVATRRINSLNPRVQVVGLSDDSHGSKISDEGFVAGFDIVCLTDASASVIKRVNEICRRAHKPFFAATSLGLHGYIFADLIDHTYIQERETTLDNGEIKKTQEKKSQSYLTFDSALKSTLNHVTPRRLKKVSPVLWACLALFEYQTSHSSSNWAEKEDLASEKLVEISRELLKVRGVDEALVPTDLLKQLSQTYRAEFAPSCAIIGAILSQEVLNVLGGKQAPIANVFVFDGQNSAGDVYALGIKRT